MFQQETQDAAYIRRTYLQDLYRFYRLFPSRNEFRNPFAGNHCIFFGKPMFTKTHLEPYFTDMAAFLFKKKMYHFASVVLDNCSKARRDVRFYLMAGYLGLHTNYHFKDQELTPVSCYRQALELQPDNERALLGLARALFSQEQYEEALEAYHQLATLQPAKKSYLLNRAVCLIRMSRYTEALKDLYRLNYESPDDANVNRVLAWALTGDEKYEQAEKIYAQLLSEEKPRTEDLLNYGYCLWLNGQVDDAADCFHRYLKETELPASFILENEQQLLMERGITEPEMQMMLYLL
jgi:Flp pilus assembly protein TadD